ncbi:MAG: hypothetical protein Q9178_001066 [Gyalolechia marmorata]
MSYRGAPRGRGGSFGGGRGGGAPREMGAFVHACEGEMLCESVNPKIPYFNAPIYLENKTAIGKVDEILGPINQVYFTIKPQEGIVATSFKTGDKFYIGDFFPNQSHRQVRPNQSVRVERQEGVQCGGVEEVVGVVVVELLGEGEGLEVIEEAEEGPVGPERVASALAVVAVEVVMQISRDLQEDFEDGAHSIFAWRCGARDPFRTL